MLIPPCGGYLVLLLGTLLEGETVVVAAGFAAHRGYLSLPVVWLVALAGSFAGDQVYFYLGRRHGRDLLARRPAWQPKVAKARRWLERHQNWLALGFRFLYGLRIIVPFAYGMSDIRTVRFVMLNGIGAVLWALAVGSAGYAFGTVLEAFLGELRHLEAFILAAILFTGLLIWLIRLWRRRRRLAHSESE